MSKKPAKSDRSVDLPDWADDVTPADEVMRKFYAPTGTFKPGPIAPSELDSPLLSPEALRESAAAHESRQGQETQGDTVESESGTPFSASPLPQERGAESSLTTPSTPVTEIREEAVLSALPPSTTASPRPLRSAAAAVKSEAPPPQPKAATETRLVLASDKSTSYEDFARKWRMYFYPGQLAVMRILYEQTYAVGATDCFTRYSEIARATKMSRRNCINVVNSLVNRGFVERLEVRNDASAKGIRLRIHLEPSS